MIDVPDSEILPLSLEHGFWTWSAQAKVSPIPVKSARGVYFWDVDGKRYLDLNSMVMCANIGHGDERVIAAIVEQAHELPFAGPPMATRPRAALGKLLANWRAVVENAVVSKAEREDKKRGQERLFE